MSGTYPRVGRALQALHDAGFEEYLGQSERIRGPKGTSLKIRQGSTVHRLSPVDWLDLWKFLSHHGALSEDETDAIYAAFGECVENVRHHAYERRALDSRWYALAIRPSKDRPARAVVLDRGVGIPASLRVAGEDKLLGTLRKVFTAMMVFDEQLLKNWETIRARYPKIAALDDGEGPIASDVDELGQVVQALKNSDFVCLLLATQGLRTRTAEARRGTGLTGLREAVLNMPHGAMHVLSGRAVVTWRPGAAPKSNVLPRLHGTAVCLELGQRAIEVADG
jgi:hypothetical protein